MMARRRRRGGALGTWASFALLGSLWLAASGSGCRASVPDEHVYTGREPGPTQRAEGGRPASAAGGTPQLTAGGGGAVGGAFEPGRGGGAPLASGGANGGEAGDSSARAGAPAEPEPLPTFSKDALLESIAICSEQAIADFAERAAELEGLARLEDEPPGRDAQALRLAWQSAMDSLQRLESFRFGPFARASEDPRGADLRDQIYAWPLGGRCNIEAQLVSLGFESATFASSLINLRGMGTLEYLLFYPGSDNACPAYSAINSEGTWSALGSAELQRRKRSYVRVVAADVALRANALLRAWRAGFAAEFAAGRAYATPQAALNAVSNALFYVEVEVKDLKLGVPLGLSPDCGSATCPETLESRYALWSRRNLSQNLRGFRALFSGCGTRGKSALGFDDWLAARGATELAERMLRALHDAEQRLAQSESPLEAQLVSEPASVRAIYDGVKTLTDLLKTEFVSVLELELPKSTEGDND